MKPKIIATFVPTGGRRIIELALEILNKPDPIAKISSLLAEHNINILWGSHAAAPEDKVEIWGLFVEVPKDLNLNELISKLKSLNVVYSERKYGQFLADTLYYPVLTTTGAENILMIRGKVYIGWYVSAFDGSRRGDGSYAPNPVGYSLDGSPCAVGLDLHP